MKETVLNSSINANYKIAGYIYDDIKNADANGKPKGILHILHGMTDYLGRYHKLIDELNDMGYVVCGIDMLGHGKTMDLNRELGLPPGFFGEGKESTRCMLEDEYLFAREVKEKYPDVPMVLYGHSMGSFMARCMYADAKLSSLYEGFIFSSTMGKNPAVGIGIALSGLACKSGLSKKPGKFFHWLAFASYNSRYKDKKTNFDWLSTNTDSVNEYVNDRYSSFCFTNKGFNDMFRFVKQIQQKESYINHASKPCLLVYGTEDPVAGYGKGAHEVCEKYRAAGCDVREKNLGPYRHELLNEKCGREYIDIVIDFTREMTGNASRE